jgi:hypothetical protein
MPLPSSLPPVNFSSCRTFLARVGDLDGINILVSNKEGFDTLAETSRVEGWAFVRELRRTQQGAVIIVAKVIFDRSMSENFGSSSTSTASSGSSAVPSEYKKLNGKWFWVLPYEYRALKIDSKELVSAAQIDISLGRHRDNALLDKSLLMLIGGYSSLCSSTTTTIISKKAPRSLTLYSCMHDDVFFYYLLDYIEGGDLQSLCAKRIHAVNACSGDSSLRSIVQTLPVSESKLKKIFRDIFSTLSFLHEQGFAHRDVSPENILIDTDGSGILIDFGAAVQMTKKDKSITVDRFFSDAVNSTMSESDEEEYIDGNTLDGWLPLSPPSGSPFCKLSYADPQYVWRQKWYGVAGDLFSAGITMFAAIEGAPLYAAPSALDTRFSLLLPRKPSEREIESGSRVLEPRFREWMMNRHGAIISESFIDLVASLIRIAPEERPLSAASVLCHRWFLDED